MKKILYAVGIILGIVAMTVVVGNLLSLDNNVPQASLATNSCAVSTVTPATVGNQVSTTLLSSASNRAWAIIQQPLNATNTTSISFDEGAAAVLGEGISLQTASTTDGISYMKFGLSTELPYTGAVTGITNTGSTTVQIIQCLYN